MADYRLSETQEGEHRVMKPLGMHRDDVLLAKLLRVRARLGLVHHSPIKPNFPTELRLLDEVIEELHNDV